MFAADGAVSDPVDRVLNGVDALNRQCEFLVVVTNDVGSDGISYGASTAAYIEALGRINAALAARADTVLELVAGIPILLKGELPE
jgi:adenosylcobinamide kinase/adenosylcobinamide-phosphate guanylyltransferase